VPTVLEILAQLNPWWQGGEREAGVPREIYLSQILRYLHTGEIVVLSGVRRSGKTTLLYQAVRNLIDEENIEPKNILFVNFDEPGLASLENPIDQILDIYRKDVSSADEVYFIFDEIQAIPGWERHIKSLYDRKRYHLIISGSSSTLLGSALSRLLSGRYFAIPVFPLDFKEYLQFHDVQIRTDPVALASDKFQLLNFLRQYLREGGFPRVVLEPDESLKREYLKSYYDSIVYRDIILINEVRNVKALKDLLYYLFSNVSRLYSYRTLQDLLKIDFTTLKEFIEYAADAKILFEVQYFSYSLKAQARNNKKIYCIDNGLRNALAFRFSEDEGALAENLVYVELRKRGFEPYYWNGVNEVDFVIKNSDNALTAINVTYTDTVDSREIRGLEEFQGEFGSSVKERIVLTKDLEKVESGIRFIPLWRWLLNYPD